MMTASMLDIEWVAAASAAGLLVAAGLSHRQPLILLRWSALLLAVLAGGSLLALPSTLAGGGAGALALVALVAALGACVCRYASAYMVGEPRLRQFAQNTVALIAVSLLTAATDSIVLFVLAWCSASVLVVRLIGHDAASRDALRAADQARVLFLIADAALVLAASALVSGTGALTFSTLALPVAQVAGEQHVLLSAIAAGLVAAAAVRAAAVPFQRWLMQSMTAPTPVSALMHAGFVNGGGIACLKFAPVFVQVPTALSVLFLVGALSVICGTAMLMLRSDVKGRLAASTVAQMGYLAMQCGLGAFGHAVFHIVAHGIFKGQAFLRSGSAVQATGTGGVASRAPAWTHLLAPAVFVVLFSRGVDLPGILLAAVLTSAVSEAAFAWAAQRGAARIVAQAMLMAGVAAAAFAPLPGSMATPAGPAPDPASLLPAAVIAAVLVTLAGLAFSRSRAIALPAALTAALVRLSAPKPAAARRPVAARSRRRELAGEAA